MKNRICVCSIIFLLIFGEGCLSYQIDGAILDNIKKNNDNATLEIPLLETVDCNGKIDHFGDWTVWLIVNDIEYYKLKSFHAGTVISVPILSGKNKINCGLRNSANWVIYEGGAIMDVNVVHHEVVRLETVITKKYEGGPGIATGGGPVPIAMPFPYSCNIKLIREMKSPKIKN